MAEEDIATLNQVVGQSLGFARMPATPKASDLVKVPEAALRIHQRRIETKKIYLVKDLPNGVSPPGTNSRAPSGGLQSHCGARWMRYLLMAHFGFGCASVQCRCYFDRRYWPRHPSGITGSHLRAFPYNGRLGRSRLRVADIEEDHRGPMAKRSGFGALPPRQGQPYIPDSLSA